MVNAIEIGKRIESARSELNLTQDELAKELGLNKSTIQRYETGKVQRIKIPILEAMAKVLNVSPEWLSNKSNSREINSQKNQSTELSSENINHLEKYNMLNDLGKIKLNERLDELLELIKYKK